MTNVKSSLLLTAMFFSSSLHAITLEQSVNEVLATNPAVQERLKNYRATLQDLNIAKSGYYPKLDLQSGIGHEKAKFHNKNYEDTDYQVYENSLTLTQNLFNGFATTKLVEYQKNRIMAASYYYIEKANDAAFQMVNSYIELIRHKELVEVVKQNLAANLVIYEKVKALYDNGLTTLSEVEKINSSVALARSNVVVQENNLMDAQFNFQRVLGRHPIINELVVPNFNAALPKTQDEASSYAVQNNPSLLVTNYNIEGERSLLEQKRSAYYPKVDFQVSQEYNKNYSEEIADTKDDKLRAMLLLRYNFYNGGADRAEIKKQISVINQQNDNKADLKRQVIQSLELSWSTYTKVAEQLKHLYNYRDFSLKTLKLYEEEYDFGKRTLLDLLAAQNDYDSAQQEIITAKYAHLLAKYRILDAMGTMVTSILDSQSDYIQEVGFKPDSDEKQNMPEDKLPVSYDSDNDRVVDIDDLCDNSAYLKNTLSSGCRDLTVQQDYLYRFGAFYFADNKQNVATNSANFFSEVKDFFGNLVNKEEDSKAADTQPVQESMESVELNLNNESQNKLEELLSFLQQATNIQLIEIVSNHSQKTAGPELQNLVAQQTNQFKQYLLDNGISEQIIETISRGSEALIASEEVAAGQALNNRIEVVVHLKKPQEAALAQ